MFESALVRKSANVGAVDAGLLAETLVFYQNIHVLLDPSTLVALLQVIGADNFRRLIDDQYMKVSYFENFLGTMTDRSGGVPEYSFEMFTSAPGAESGRPRKLSKSEQIAHYLQRSMGKSSETLKIASYINKKVPAERLIDANGAKINLIAQAKQDIFDGELDTLVRAVMRGLLPNYSIPLHWRFQAHETDNGFFVATNYDFSSINKEYHRYVPPSHSTIDPAYILSHVLDARADLIFSAKHLSELITTPAISQVLGVRFSIMLTKRTRSSSEISAFQDMHLDGRSVREAINSGERSFSEFLDVLDKSRKFKDWLKAAHPDVGLLKEYYRAVTSETWLERLPSKGVRFAVFTGLGILADVALPTGIGTATGVTLGAGDSFILDKVIRGWKPNQYIEEELRPFVIAE